MAKSTSSKSSKNIPATTMAELLASANYQMPVLKRNQEVSGKVVVASGQEILVDIGAKSEGVISGRELSGARDLVVDVKVGDIIEATVLYPENDAGQVVLTLRGASGEKRWQQLAEKKESAQEVTVMALEANRGGIIGDYLGLRGFLPASQLATLPANLTDLIGKNLAVRVIDVDRSSNRLIFSQKGPQKKDLTQIVKLLAKIKIGAKYEGLVTAILPFGIFVEIEIGSVGKLASRQVGEKPISPRANEPTSQKLEGLVHISEISWEKVDDPGRLFKVGDRVEVAVIAKDTGSGRLNLSIKQLQEDPFVKASGQYSRDQKVSGVVSKITPYGVLVSLQSGVEGLMHNSKIPPNISYNIGDKVEAEIESVDAVSRRIALVPIVREKPVLYR